MSSKILIIRDRDNHTHLSKEGMRRYELYKKLGLTMNEAMGVLCFMDEAEVIME